MTTDWLTLRARTMRGGQSTISVRLSSLRITWHHQGATLQSNDRGVATMIVDEPAALLDLAKAVGLASVPDVVQLRPAS